MVAGKSTPSWPRVAVVRVYALRCAVSVVCARASVREKVRESMGETLPCGQIDLAPYSSSCQASLKCNTTEYCATVENLSNGAVSRRQQRWHVAHPFACVCVHSHPSPLVLDDHRTLLFISTHRTITSLDCRLSNERQWSKKYNVLARLINMNYDIVCCRYLLHSFYHWDHGSVTHCFWFLILFARTLDWTEPYCALCTMIFGLSKKITIEHRKHFPYAYRKKTKNKINK